MGIPVGKLSLYVAAGGFLPGYLSSSLLPPSLSLHFLPIFFFSSPMSPRIVPVSVPLYPRQSLPSFPVILSLHDRLNQQVKLSPFSSTLAPHLKNFSTIPSTSAHVIPASEMTSIIPCGTNSWWVCAISGRMRWCSLRMWVMIIVSNSWSDTRMSWIVSMTIFKVSLPLSLRPLLPPPPSLPSSFPCSRLTPQELERLSLQGSCQLKNSSKNPSWNKR